MTEQQTKSVYLGVINEESVEAVIQLNPTLLFVNSGGGDINSALTLLDYAERTGLQVHISGQCSSAALYLLALKPGKVTIANHTYGIQHAPEILRDVNNHMPGLASCWLRASKRQWDADRSIWSKYTDNGMEMSDNDVVYLTEHEMREVLYAGVLRQHYVGEN